MYKSIDNIYYKNIFINKGIIFDKKTYSLNENDLNFLIKNGKIIFYIEKNDEKNVVPEHRITTEEAINIKKKYIKEYEDRIKENSVEIKEKSKTKKRKPTKKVENKNG